VDEDDADVVIRRTAEGTLAAYNAHDLDALRLFYAADCVGYDHRPLGLGQFDVDQLIAYFAGLFAQVRNHRVATLSIESRGSIAMLRTFETAETLTGSEFSFENIWVGVVVAGQVQLVHVFTAEAEADARARFEQLAAAQPKNGDQQAP
jgi:hypothetical protein